MAADLQYFLFIFIVFEERKEEKAQDRARQDEDKKVNKEGSRKAENDRGYWEKGGTRKNVAERDEETKRGREAW